MFHTHTDKLVPMSTDRQTDRPASEQIDRKNKGKQTNEQTDGRTNKQVDISSVVSVVDDSESPIGDRR